MPRRTRPNRNRRGRAHSSCHDHRGLHSRICAYSYSRANVDTSTDLDSIARADLDSSRSGAPGNANRRTYAFTNSVAGRRNYAHCRKHAYNYCDTYYHCNADHHADINAEPITIHPRDSFRDHNRDTHDYGYSHYHANSDCNGDRCRAANIRANANYHCYSDLHIYSNLHAYADHNIRNTHAHDYRNTDHHAYSSLHAYTDYNADHNIRNAYSYHYRHTDHHGYSNSHFNIRHPSNSVADQHRAPDGCTHSHYHCYSDIHAYPYYDCYPYCHGNT